MSGDEYKYILFVSFDLDAESAEVYRGSDPDTLSRGRFGVNRGVWKILDTLDRYGVKSTFFTPAWVIERYGEVVEEIVSRGHEVAAHGYLHESFDKLSIAEEESVFNKIEGVFKELVGYKPIGFRSPYWRWSSNTIDFLCRYGYVYDSSLMDDEYPYILKHRDCELIELPVDWRLDDWPYLEHYRSVTHMDLLDQWMDEIRYVEETGGYLSLTMHPQCIGRGSRIRLLEKILEYVFKTGGWVVNGRDLALFVKENAERLKIMRRVYPRY